MADSKKKGGLDLPQTRGTFQVRGIVDGVQNDKFFTEKKTKTNKNWRAVNFRVTFDDKKSLYVGLNGMEQDNVYFSKRGEKPGDKPITEEVPWDKRFLFAKEGFRLMGVNLGVSKVKDEKGNDVNDKKVLTPYDACKEINDNLVDDVTVFVKGNIEHSQYNDSHSTKFVPSQISLGKDVDFTAEDFKPNAQFTQSIVYMSCTPNEDKTKATIAAKIVNYNSIEDAEFVMYDMGLARMFNKKLKPYTHIKVWGDINVVQNVEEVEETDCWGTKNKMDVVTNPTTRELVITGADPETIDANTYSEDKMDEAIAKLKAAKRAENDYGSNDTWGSVNSNADDNDEVDGW